MSEPKDSFSLSGYLTRRLCPLTNYQQQGQLLALLFRELSLAVRHRFPLDLVLEGIADSRRFRPGALYLHLVLFVALIAIVGAMILAGSVGWGITVLVLGVVGLLALVVRRHNDFVRYVAGQLRFFVVCGKTLSEAMLRVPLIFSRQERQTVAMGEKTGHLAEALDMLADYHSQAGRFNRLFAAILYPLAVFTFCLSIVSFIFVKIIPKYVDIFAQLGADLPVFSNWFLNAAVRHFYPFIVLLVFLFPLLLLMIVTLLVPFLIRGSAVLTGLFLLFSMLVFSCLFVPWALAIANPVPAYAGIMVPLAAGLAASLAAAVVFYLLLRWINATLVPLAQRAAAWLLGWAAPMRKIQLARFLLSLGYSLRAKVPMPEALEMAGQITGARMRREAARLRTLVEQGHSLSDGLESSSLITGQVRAILSLSEWRGALADDCIEVAEQLRFEAIRASERLAAFIEWPSIVLVGVILGSFVIAAYWPLFCIPQLIK